MYSMFCGTPVLNIRPLLVLLGQSIRTLYSLKELKNKLFLVLSLADFALMCVLHADNDAH